MVSRRNLLSGLAATTGGLALGTEARPFVETPWPNGARGAVSLSYDDGLSNQSLFAAPELARRGWRGDFFLTLDNMRDAFPAWKAVAAAGHEIGNHTTHHRCDLRPFAPGGYIRDEVMATQVAFDQAFGPLPRQFAYPCSVTNLGRGGPNVELHRFGELLRGQGFLSARTSDGPPMTQSYAWTHRMALTADAPTYEKDDPAEAIAYLDEALKGGRWAILVFHTLAEARTESGATSLKVHSAILDAIAARPLWCAPIGEVLAHIRPK